MYSLWDMIGATAAILTTGALFPQIMKTIRTKDASSFSLAYLIIFISGVCLWTIYGIMIRSYPVIAANSLTGVLATMILCIKVVYR